MKERQPKLENESQAANTVIMISPDTFKFNAQTADSNTFQKYINKSQKEIGNEALKEFRAMVGRLETAGIKVLVLPSRADIETPDAVFPNNWVSIHPDKKMVIYPMLAPNRRAERQVNLVEKQLAGLGFYPRVIDLSSWEDEGKVLEGTGSLVLDRENKVAFAIESSRTNKEAFERWCRIINYEGVFFHASDEKNEKIYHTNVIMGIGTKFAVLCLDSIKDNKERETVLKRLQASGREIITINLEQVRAYCGNVLELKNQEGETKIIMSQTSLDAFTEKQRDILEKFGDILAVNISTIESIGGGSARCMLAEVFT